MDGRFSWAFVGLIIFVTFSLLVADFVWRVVTLPFDTLAIYMLIADFVAALFVIGACLLYRRRENASKAYRD